MGSRQAVMQTSLRSGTEEYRKFQHSTRSDRIGYTGVRGYNNSNRKMKIMVNWDVMLCYFQVKTSNVRGREVLDTHMYIYIYIYIYKKLIHCG